MMDEDDNLYRRPATPPAMRSNDPKGPTAEFVRQVQAMQGEPYVRSWLTSRTCSFTDTTVYTIGLAAERLMRDVGHIAKKCGVTVRFCAVVSERFHRQEASTR